MKRFEKILIFPFHTIFLCVYPILYLYARNSVFVPAADIQRPLIFTMGTGIFFLLGFVLILHRWEISGILASLVVLLILSFGHVFNQLETAFPFIENNPGSITWLAWGWMGLFVVLAYFILQIKKPANVTLFLNIVSLTLILFPLVSIFSNLIVTNPANLQAEREKLAGIRQQSAAEANMFTLGVDKKPDIYYIIFDSYERADKLKDLYGFDNAKFISALEERGFYVASNSRSNYLNTTYSLNTALNLVYYSDFPEILQRNAKLNLQTNYVSEFLRRQGYRVVLFDSGTGDSNNQYADEFITPVSTHSDAKPLLNPFETLAIRTTIGLVFLKGAEQSGGQASMNDMMAATVNRELEIRRSRVYSAFNRMPDYAQDDNPHFLFAHIYLPHIPFLFGANGRELTYQKDMNFYWYEPAPENFIEQYLYQIEYLNSAILPVIDRIKAESKRPVVIILQSDHGDDKYLDWNNPSRQGVDVRSSIFNAIYYSDGFKDEFYPTMTTVNTFRMVLNHWFGTRYPILPETTYFHNHPLTQSPGDIPGFVNACEQFDICIPPPAK